RQQHRDQGDGLERGGAEQSEVLGQRRSVRDGAVQRDDVQRRRGVVDGPIAAGGVPGPGGGHGYVGQRRGVGGGGVQTGVDGGGTLPTVKITKPASGVWTGNSIGISATATSSVALVNIKFWGNGAVFATATCSTMTCNADMGWITGPLPPAAYQVQAVATDSA